ncbi:hypothetical protein EMN47_06310 [Prolixibacteraceae bacterium JC049]|nr:hypothetical protein [Prolixibacteraceae bacterium JC049]
MKCKALLILLVLLGSTGISFGQFKLSGEFRPRTELSHGYKALAAPDQDASLFTSQRTRLNFNYQNEWVKTMLVLQDVRTWGNQKQLVANEDKATSIHQAWAEIMLTKDLFLKAGRMELVYDDHRIFGSVGWAQQARSHDLFLLKYEGNVKLHFGIAHNENNNIKDGFYGGPNAYKAMQFLWYNNTGEKMGMSLLFLNNGVPYIEDNKEKIRYSQTIGGRFTYKEGNFNLGTNLYYQGGKHKSGKDVSALNLGIDASLKAGENWTFIGGFEHLSGTDYNESEDMKSFTPFYGTNHKFNGFMDYFYVGNHVGSVGLNDIYLKAKYKKNKFSMGADLHFFSAAADVSSTADKGLGTELDLYCAYKHNKAVTFSAGLSNMFGTDALQELKGGDKGESNYWGYFMITVKPSFLNLK